MLRAQSGLSETILLMCTSAIWGKYPVFSLPEFLQGSLTVGSGCSLMAANWQVFFPSWVLSGLTSSPSAMTAVADDGDSLCLLIWQVLFHLSVFWVLIIFSIPVTFWGGKFCYSGSGRAGVWTWESGSEVCALNFVTVLLFGKLCIMFFPQQEILFL